MPSSAGAVMWWASPDRPKPTTSAMILAPRALACLSSSSTRAPAPSPMTKPSRSLSQGRDAICGVSLKLVDSARAAQNPAMPSRHTAASAPPAIITLASSSMISRAASPIACAPVEHAVTTEWLGPLNPNLIDTCPDTRLIRLAGMKNGLTRRMLPLSTRTAFLAISFRPPMPDPIMTPVRTWSSSVSAVHPESATAWIAAVRP